MKFKKDELLDVLYTVKPGLAKKAIVEQATHFIFTGEDVCTYNDQVSISCPIETDFKCSVPADKFYDVLSKIDSDEIDISLKDNELIIKGKKVKSGLSISTEDEVIKILDEMDFPDDKDWKKLPTDFIDGIKLCMFSVSKDISHPYLSNILVYDNNIMSSDDNRISLYEMKSKIKDRFLIPGTSITSLIDFDIKEYFLGESWIYFVTDDDVIFCSRIVNNETGMSNMIEAEDYFDFDHIQLELPDELLKAIDTTSILADGEFDIDKRIDIIIENGVIKCRGEKQEIGWIEVEEKINNFKNNEKIEITINPIFLQQILKKSLIMNYGDDRALFISDNFKHLISLIVE